MCLINGDVRVGPGGAQASGESECVQPAMRRTQVPTQNNILTNRLNRDSHRPFLLQDEYYPKSTVKQTTTINKETILSRNVCLTCVPPVVPR